MSQVSKSGGKQRESLLTGAAAGVGAYVVGYLLTFVLMRGSIRRTFDGSVPAWKATGWYFYNAHFVDLVSSRSVGPFGDATVVSLIAESTGTTATLLYAVPPLALLLAGAAVAWRLDGADLATAAAGGAATVAGYGLLAVVGALAFAHTLSGSFLGVETSATFTIPLGTAVIVVGLLYPGFFGTLGAGGGSVLVADR